MRFNNFYSVNSAIQINDKNEEVITDIVEELLQKFADKYGLELWEVDRDFFELHIIHLGNSIYCIKLKHIFNAKDTFERAVIFAQEQEEDEAEQLNDMLELIFSIMALTENVGFDMFLNVICMLLEERCKQEKKDIVEIAMFLQETIAAVNAEHGRY